MGLGWEEKGATFTEKMSFDDVFWGVCMVKCEVDSHMFVSTNFCWSTRLLWYSCKLFFGRSGS